MSFKAYYLSPEGDLRYDLNEEDTRAVFESRRGLLWVDIDEPKEGDGKLMEQGFHFHHLAVEDSVSPVIHSPKIDDFGDYIFILFNGINHISESDIVETTQLAVFLGSHFVVSIHHLPLYSVEAVRQLVEGDGRPMRYGADFLLHAVVDALIDNVLPIIDRMSELTDDIEEESIRNPQQATLEAILKLKRSALRIHRGISPQRDVLNRLSRGEFPLIKAEAQIFYRDVYDHLMRIEDLNQLIRDRADNALATYMSSVANRQNETMRILSIVAAIFMPLTLIAGIYGMNFEYMPELKWHWGYFAVLGLMGTAIVAVLWWFWARSWITWGRRQASRVKFIAVPREKLIGYVGYLARQPHQKRE